MPPKHKHTKSWFLLGSKPKVEPPSSPVSGSPSGVEVEGLAPGSPLTVTASAGHDYTYPNGHLGRLTELQAQKLEAFKSYIATHVSSVVLQHDDPTLLRYLRARKWVVEDAYEQLKTSDEWRASNDVDLLYETIDLAAYEQAWRLYPQWTGRRDRRGIPVYVFNIQDVNSKLVEAYEASANNTFSKAKWDGKTSKGLLRLFALYENLTRFVQPLCSQLQHDRPVGSCEGVPVTSSINIVDVTGVTLKQFWNLKSHMQAASLLATTHYPETLDRIYIIGAPSFFSTVWEWIKRWFDPVTVSKTNILPSDPAEVFRLLSQHIEPCNIPKAYGGELDFKWGREPVLDDTTQKQVIQWCNGFSTFPKGPLYWRDLGDGNLECLAVGSVNQKERRARVALIKMTCPSHPGPNP